jgi:hypothetical protein
VDCCRVTRPTSIGSVDGPHDLAGTLHPVLLEEREELVLLPQAVLVDLRQAFYGAGESIKTAQVHCEPVTALALAQYRLVVVM